MKGTLVVLQSSFSKFHEAAFVTTELRPQQQRRIIAGFMASRVLPRHQLRENVYATARSLRHTLPMQCAPPLLSPYVALRTAASLQQRLCSSVSTIPTITE